MTFSGQVVARRLRGDVYAKQSKDKADRPAKTNQSVSEHGFLRFYLCSATC